MAEINNQPSQKKHKQTACNKKSTRVDLAPMVDLGFILLTFFVFTAALSQPMVMNLIVPNDKDSAVKDDICETCVLTIILDEDNKIFYYTGKAENALYRVTDYSSSGIRNIIMQKKKNVLAQKGKDDFVLIIKPTSLSSFKNMIDAVDECSINMVKHYYIDELNEKDKKWLKEKIED